MAQYAAFNPEAKIIGQAILGFARALGERAQPILVRHGLVDIKPDQWYPQQAWLDALREFDQSDIFDLVAVGRQVAAMVPLPAEVNSVESVLMLIGKTYDHNNQGCPGKTVPEKVDEQHIKVTVHDPFPHNMVYGVLYGFAARFEPRAIVLYDESTPFGSDSETFIYHVTW